MTPERVFSRSASSPDTSTPAARNTAVDVAVEGAAVGRDPPAVGQVMAVADHDDARGAVAIGFRSCRG